MFRARYGFVVGALVGFLVVSWPIVAQQRGQRQTTPTPPPIIRNRSASTQGPGQRTMAQSSPVVIASDQSPVAVFGTITAAQATGTNLHMVCDSGCSGSTAPADRATFTYGATSFSPVGGVYNSSITSLTSGQMGAVALTTARKMHSALYTPDDAALTSSTAGATRPLDIIVRDTSGNAITSFGGSGGSSQNDNTAFTYGTTPISVAGCVYNSSITAITSGRAGSPACDATRNLFTVLRDAAGNARGANINASNQLSVSVDNTVTVGSHAVTNAGTFAVQAAQTGTWTVQPGNTANTTAWLMAGGKTNNAAAPGATNLGVLNTLANASAPTWVEGNLVTLSSDLAGNIRTLSAGAIASGSADSGNPVKVGGKYNSSPITLTTGNRGDLQLNVSGYLKTAPGADTVVDTPVLANALSTSVVTVTGSPAILDAYFCSNPNTAAAYVQIFDISGAVTLGASVPKWSLRIPPNDGAGNMAQMKLSFANAVKVAATTTATGSGAPTTALDCNFGYRVP